MVHVVGYIPVLACDVDCIELGEGAGMSVVLGTDTFLGIVGIVGPGEENLLSSSLSIAPVK